MKYNLLVILLVTIYSCSISKIKKEVKKSSLDLTSYNSEDFEFSVLVYDCNDNNYFIFNDSLSKIPFSPASTFKIANAIVALENKIVTNENFELPWDSVNRVNPAWNKTQNLNSAFKNSTVWYFQEIARRIGSERMIDGLRKIDYCDTTFAINNDIDGFWLNGNLKKSLKEQVLFVEKLASKKLKVKKSTYRVLKNIMASDTISNSYVYSKTGWGVDGNEDIGWYIGYVLKDNKIYTFGTLLKTSNYEKVDIIKLRKEITIYALKSIGILS
jgi:beta-lactamase class D